MGRTGAFDWYVLDYRSLYEGRNGIYTRFSGDRHYSCLPELCNVALSPVEPTEWCVEHLDIDSILHKVRIIG